MRQPVAAELDARELQDRVVAFVRAFGLHRPENTPCGEPVAVSQAHALTELAAGGPLAQWELATALGLSKSTVSRLVGQLEERGWLERGRDNEGDGRVVKLHLTPAGLATAARIADARRARMDRLLANLPEADRPAVMHALKILTEAAGD